MNVSSEQNRSNQGQRNMRVWLVLLCVLLVGVGAWWLTHRSTAANEKATNPDTNKDAAKTATAPQAALTVTLASPTTQVWPRQLNATGNVAAWQEVVIGSEISGYRLTDVNVNVGDRVRRGQVLAVINSASLNAEILQARAALAEAEAVLADATLDANRVRGMQNNEAFSRQEIAKYLTSQQTAKARLDAARASLQIQQVRLSQGSIISPDDGVISARTATVGSLTQAGQALFTLIREGRLEWRAEVTADELSQIRIGMPVQVMSSSNPNAAAVNGTVRMIAPSVDEKTRNALVYVDVPSNTDLRAGMFVRGRLNVGDQAVLTLPQSATLLRDGFAYVFVVDRDQRVHEQKITLGERLNDRVAVIGLDTQAQVVATGGAFLSDGDRVRVVQMPAPRPTTAPTTSTTATTATTALGSAS